MFQNRYVVKVLLSCTLCCLMYVAYAFLMQLLSLMELVLWAYCTAYCPLSAFDTICPMTSIYSALDTI